MTTTVAQDVRELVHATQLEPPALLEKDPPNWHWHLPLGFVTLAAAGTLLIAAATLVLTALLYITIPKGFFPTQDTGIIQGISQAAGSTSFAQMTQLQQRLGEVVLADPAVESISSFIGADGTNTTLNSGRIQINLKPVRQRGICATEVIRRLGPKLARVAGIKLYMQPVQDLAVDDRADRWTRRA